MRCGASRLENGRKSWRKRFKVQRSKLKVRVFAPLLKLCMSLLEILGLSAGTITSITFLPQVIQIWKTKSAKDLSLGMLALLIFGVSLWLVYGIIAQDIAIIYTNSMVLMMSFIMLFFKLRFSNKD